MLDPLGLDIHLLPSSPCRDAGNPLAAGLPTIDFEGDPRVLGMAPDMGADEYLLSPIVESVSPSKTHYDKPVPVVISGQGFTSSATVMFGGKSATGVVVVNETTIACTVPAGMPGPVDVKVISGGEIDILPGGFAYTPAASIDPSAPPGGAVTLTFLQDPGDWLLGIFGLPPVLSVPTPPYAGALSIWPLHKLFMVPAWPFDSLSQVLTVPDDPALSGVQVLFQALVGPSLVGAVDAAWTNCAVFTIQ